MNHCTKCGNNVPARCHTCEEAGFDPSNCTTKPLATRAFIEDAKAGGWDQNLNPRIREFNDQDLQKSYEMALLDPLAWQAVGKTRVWTSQFEISTGLVDGTIDYGMAGKVVDKWEYEWHRFIDHLADGKTIDEAIAALIE